MATAAKINRPTDAKTRSLTLAHMRGLDQCTWRARTQRVDLDERSGELVTLKLAIGSFHRDQTYTVTYHAATDDARCACEAAQFGRPCTHRGVAIICGREAAALYSPEGREQALREWLLDQRAEANALALRPSL